MLHTKEFGKYQIIRKLARGMTDVYLAFDNGSNCHAVLKIVEESPDPLTQLILEAERRGAEIQKQLHAADSRVIEIFEWGRLDGYFYVAMQYIEGRTVAEILKQEQRIEPQRAARFARDILNQLDKLHSFQTDIDGQRRSVVHGDIKPSNVQIGANDEVRLLDFGIAKALTFTHSRTHLSLGSPGYCSPERLSNGQVDRDADLWAVGVTLYEMVAGSPPYQAQDTRKLEELIQSRRPPRALPENLPRALAAIIEKALAGDLHQRYVSAAAFGTDLQRYLQNQVTSAESERRTAWPMNPTIEKPRPTRIPERVSQVATTVRKRVLALAQPPGQKAASLLGILLALCWGLLAGLVVCVPIGYAYRFRQESRTLRENTDYMRRSSAEINADWDTLQGLIARNAFLGSFSPAVRFQRSVRSRLIQGADDIIVGYRDSSDPAIADFDWQKAVVCLRHAVDLNRGDRTAQAKLALADGYVNLVRAGPVQSPEQRALFQAAAASFQESATLDPHSPDPHLALARVNVYVLKNAGRAVAELHEAERLGFSAGPREIEQQADAYRMRAAEELEKARESRSRSRAESTRYLRLAQRDYDRARKLYEPIAGFSNVSFALRQVDDDERSGQRLEVQLKDVVRNRKRTASVRTRRWR